MDAVTPAMRPAPHRRKEIDMQPRRTAAVPAQRTRIATRATLVMVAVAVTAPAMAQAGTPTTAPRAVAAARLAPLDGGRISPYAGIGDSAFSGDGGPALFAELGAPFGLAVDRAGRLLIADSSNQRVRRVAPGKFGPVISTVAGSGIDGTAGDGGAAVHAQLHFPGAVAAAPDGGFYIASQITEGNPNSPVRKVTPSGIITRFAGTTVSGYGGDHGPALNALMDHPVGVAADAAGNVYITEGFRVRKVDPHGIITTYAGGATEGFSGDGGPAIAAKLERPGAIATDSHGVVYVVTGHRVRKITPNGIISTVAGNGTAALSGDGGPAVHAGLARPMSVAADGTGNVYIGDAATEISGVVRAVDAAGRIRTIAGTTGPSPRFVNYGPATETTLLPAGLALDGHGRLYISDAFHARVHALDPPLSAAAAGRCTKAAAQQLVERQHLGGFTNFTPHPVAKVLCGPFLGRHSRAMIVSLSRETCLPAGGWVVYRHVGAGWHRVKVNLSLFGMVFRHGTFGFVEKHPLPGKDGVICTSRRWVGRSWRWNGHRLVHGRYHRVKAPTHV